MQFNSKRFYQFALILLSLSMVTSRGFAGVGEGQKLYDGYCVVCHGGLGEGQPMGKPLTDAVANRLSDAELIAVISDGRSGTGMAAWSSNLSATEILDIASYIRTLQGKPGLSLADATTGVSDDPQVLAGEQLFNGSAGCATCHTYRDQGGSVGPALDGIASRLADAALQQALLNPSATIVEGYATKIVQQPDGTTVRGRFRNDSERAIQIQSEDGRRWVTFFKDRVTSISDSSESLMPAVFATLGAAEQEQLLAFLKTL